ETLVRRDGEPAERTLATFRALRNMTLLDLVELPRPASLFDSDAATDDRAATVFVNEFVEDLTRPITKDGREHVEYVPSQVVTEYVRYRLGKLIGSRIDGIRYRSARNREGIGAVLFFDQEDLVPAMPMASD